MMVDTLAPGQVRFAIHGPDIENDDVPGAVFATKLTALIRALKAADKAVNNGRSRHEYYISKLKSSTPTVVLSERMLSEVQTLIFPGVSGVAGFNACVNAIRTGERETALAYGRCAESVARLATGLQTRYSYAEIWTDEQSPVRVDPFLGERAKRIIAPLPLPPPEPPVQRWFEGISHGTFDGVIKAVDLRGALPEVKLLLTAGGKQIDCICRNLQVETLGSALNKRCRVAGLAFYEAQRGIPRRIEVTTLELLGDADDFTTWKGAFEPFSVPAWEGEDE